LIAFHDAASLDGIKQREFVALFCGYDSLQEFAPYMAHLIFMFSPSTLNAELTRRTVNIICRGTPNILAAFKLLVFILYCE
jgi:hypothetical protein